jgi:hypothetical protein
MKDIQDIGVRVTYRNKDMQPTYTKTYSLDEYTEMLRVDLLRVVTDVETLCYIANNNLPKEEWTDETFEEFNRIKHKLLDKAGDIGRLPQNIILRTSEPLNEFMAKLLDGEE